jgi:drug/metabolite transporter (DMT)-like permease
VTSAGLALAVASALGTNVAFLFKQRGAVAAPPVRARHPLRSAVELFRSRWFALGWAVAVAAWGLHVGALALAPLSTVQAVLSGGLVFLAVLAERYFGFRLGRRQWVGVIITAVGLVVIGITSGRHGDAVRRYSLAALIAVECGVLAFGTGAMHDGLVGLVSEWTLVALMASVLAFFASARGLQLGPGVAVIAFTSVAANLTAIIGGILVFRDTIGVGAPAIVGRIAAFGLVIAGAALMPAPVRANRRRRAPAGTYTGLTGLYRKGR